MGRSGRRSHSNHHAPLRLVVLAPHSHLLVHQHLQHLNVEELHHLVHHLHHLPPLDDRRGGQHSFREEHIPWSSSRTIRGGHLPRTCGPLDQRGGPESLPQHDGGRPTLDGRLPTLL